MSLIGRNIVAPKSLKTILSTYGPVIVYGKTMLGLTYHELSSLLGSNSNKDGSENIKNLKQHTVNISAIKCTKYSSTLEYISVIK